MNGRACPMERMENLLLATDGSESCRSATVEALELAKICSDKLIVLAVVLTNREYEDVMPWPIDQAEKEMREKLSAVKRLASEEGVACEIILHRGDNPYVDIIDEAERHRVDIIIMGTHRRTGARRLIMGSVTRNVIAYAPCKVLVVPPGKKINYENILVATDGSKFGAAAAYEAVAIAKRCNSTVFIVSVATSEAEAPSAEENVKQVTGLAEKEGIRNEGLVILEKPHEAIAEISRQKEVGLIVIGSQGRTGFMDLLKSSMTEGVIGNTESAVLVVKA
jgi:nucleotide-binding universal stress UspA family protein